MYPKLLILLFFVLPTIVLIGQVDYLPSFSRIELEQGQIAQITKDSEGYVWLSTQRGLVKYNGSHWKVYNKNRKDSTSISDNYTWCTMEDDQGNIWTGTFGGYLCALDKRKDEFKCFQLFEGRNKEGVRCLMQIDHRTLLVGTDGGLFIFDLLNRKIVRDSIFIKNQNNAGLFHTHFLHRLSEVHFIIAGGDGSFLVNIENKSVSKIQIGNSENRPSGPIVQWNDELLIGHPNGFHLVQFDAESYDIRLQRDYLLPANLSATDIVLINEDLAMVSSNDGIHILQLDSGENQQLKFDALGNENGLDENVYYSIAEVEKGLFWLSSKTSIYEFSTTRPNFKNISVANFCDAGLLGMSEDNDGNLWVATRKGLGRIKNFTEPEDKWEYQCFNSQNTRGLRGEYILNVMFTDNELWLGYRRKGLAKFRVDEMGELQWLSVPDFLDSLTIDHSVSEMHKDNYGNTWVATLHNGVIRYNTNSGEFKHYLREENGPRQLSHNYVYSFAEVHPGSMAIATANGITEIDIATDSTFFYVENDQDSTSLSGNFTMDFTTDPSGRIWVHSSGGLNLWNRDATFSYWTEKEGLPSDIVYGLQYYKHDIWLSTGDGLVQFNTSGFPDLSFKVYTDEDGLINKGYNQFSYLQSKAGLFLFGGNGGLTYFNPAAIRKNPKQASPVIANFNLFNEKADHLLKENIQYLEELNLTYDQNFISFDLAALSFRKSQQNQFAYKMEGLNENWISLGTRNYLSFNGLKPGNYNLSLKAANNDGIWGDDIKSIAIHIKEPIWNRWYAWLLYLSVVAAVIYYIFNMRQRYLKNILIAKEEERQKIRERSARDFHDEAGTTITKLSLLAQYLKMMLSKNTEGLDALQKIEENVQQLRLGMRDFIWVLDPGKDGIQSTLQRIRKLGNDIFEHSPTQFELIADGFNNDLQFDSNQRRQLLLICKEAMNNIVKHANANHCKILVSPNEAGISFNIKDDGVGINKNAATSGNGLKNMEERANKIGNNFNCKSETGKGTEISFTIPTQ